jgi:mannosyltransferase OCH1-like enzyme
MDFDEAMQTDKFPRAIAMTRRIVGVPGNLLFNMCKYLYIKNNPSSLPLEEVPLIPRVIHQIWIGGKVPEVFKAYMQSWIAKHPGWEYKLWCDEDVKTLHLYNRALYESVDNPGVKSDILKWEIIYQFGGVYVDVDFECLKPLDQLHYQYDFYTALQPLDTQFVQLGAALFAAKPGHPILKHCVETIKKDWHRKGAPDKTGPIHFTRSFFVTAGQNNSRDVAFPAFYFYPLGCLEHALNYEDWIKRGAFAIHHWAKSWMPPQYRLKQFKDLGNDDRMDGWNT